MATKKYGWFAAGSTKPYETYAGDYMQYQRSTNSSVADSIVAIIHLRPGESVHEL
jgi:hypothetical protein